MKKEKFHIEYVLDNVSRRSLWNHLTTSYGLSLWFADAADITGSTCIFSWGKTKETARITYSKPEVCVRYVWENETDSYFEFRIHTVELTGTVTLEITDFAEPAEKMDSISLWDSQVEELKRTLGVL